MTTISNRLCSLQFTPRYSQTRLILLNAYSSLSQAAQNAETPKVAVVKGSTFTGKPDFYEALYFMEDVLKTAQNASEPKPLAIPIPWLPLNALADRLGFALTKLEYRKIRTALNALSPFTHIPHVAEFAATFTDADLESLRNITTQSERSEALAKLSNREPDLGYIDALGRAQSVGRRKAAVANVSMVPGTGECFVNGIPAIEYFKRPYEMFRLADPFTATATFGKFNTWCIVRGGGFTGQAGAIAHGMAKAISLLEPKYKSGLEMAGLLRRDPRVVERKKPGKPKARKSFTWVKR